MMPQLVNLFGELPDALTGKISDADRDLLLSGEATYCDIQRMAGDYPELMGFWATIAAGAVKVASKIIPAVSKSVKAKKAKAKKAKAEKKARNEILKQQEAKRKQFSAMAIIGIPAVVGAVFFLTRR
jgi:hypothetical protein